MKKRRIIFCTAIMVFAIVSSILTIYAKTEKIPIPKVEENIYIYDEDNIIDDNEEKELNQMLVALENQTEAEFAVISVESLLDRSIEEYANELFNTLGIGKKETDNGVLLLISRSDKKVRLEIGRGLEGCLNDGKCGRILDEFFVPYRESDEYTKAVEMTVNATLNVIAKEYDIDIEGLNEELVVEESANESDDGGVIILIIFIIIFIIAITTGSGGGSSGRWYSGGGFSGRGFSGGSSGGSFGGGFSGGGGASR